MTARAPIARIDWENVAVAAGLGGAFGFLIVAAAGAIWNSWPVGKYIGAVLIGTLHTETAKTVQLLSLFGGAVGAFVCAVLAFEKHDGSVHATGGQLRHDSPPKIDADRKPLFSIGSPSAPFSLDRLRRSMLILGSIGSGKTQVILNLLRKLQGAGFRCLVVDSVKGDYSARIPDAWKPLILAPWRAGPSWDIGRDCRTRNHAIALAAQLIPVSEKDPLWGTAAGMVVVTCICKLQAEQGTHWGWTDLYQLINSDVEDLFEFADAHYPPARQILADAQSKTTQSILVNLQGYMGDVMEMALAWENTTEKFSFSEWWMAEEKDETQPQFVILQGSAEFQRLAGAYISGILKLLAGLTASPSMPESDTRKNIIVVDEFAQLPKIPGFEKFFEIGRSKGCSAVLATQSGAQVEQTWGELLFRSWMAMIGTKIILRIIGAGDQEFATRELGKAEVYIPNVSSSSNGNGGSETLSWQKEKRELVRADQLADLGPQPNGVSAFIAGFGSDVYRVVFPYVKLPIYRPAILPNPDFDKHVGQSRIFLRSSPDEVQALATHKRIENVDRAEPVKTVALQEAPQESAHEPFDLDALEKIVGTETDDAQ